MSFLRSLQFGTKHLKLFRSPTISNTLQCGVHIKAEPAKAVVKSESVDYHDEGNMERCRPLSPYISIYATQLQGVQSIHNRVTDIILCDIPSKLDMLTKKFGRKGAIWTFELATLAIAALVLPESVDYYVNKIDSWNLDPTIICACKCLIAWPMVYHTVDGIRHVLWDFGMVLTNKSVMISGWLVIIVAVAGTLYLSLMV